MTRSAVFGVLSSLALIVLLVVLLGGRRSADIMEVNRVDESTFELIVDSCNGNPEVVRITQRDNELEVRVEADPRNGDDCQDLLSMTVEDLQATTLVDASSGAEFSLERTPAPGDG